MNKKCLFKETSTEAPVKHFSPALIVETLIETDDQAIDNRRSTFTCWHKKCNIS